MPFFRIGRTRRDFVAWAGALGHVRQAKKHSPAFVHDEIDAVGRQRGRAGPRKEERERRQQFSSRWTASKPTPLIVIAAPTVGRPTRECCAGPVSRQSGADERYQGSRAILQVLCARSRSRPKCSRHPFARHAGFLGRRPCQPGTKPTCSPARGNSPRGHGRLRARQGQDLRGADALDRDERAREPNRRITKPATQGVRVCSPARSGPQSNDIPRRARV